MVKKPRKKTVIIILAVIALWYAAESLWHSRYMHLDFQILVDEDFHGGIAIACGNAEFAALAREFAAIEDLNELEYFINGLSRPAGRDTYVFCRKIPAGIQRHIDAEIVEIVTRQALRPFIFPYDYNEDRRRHLMERSALLTVITDVGEGPVTLSECSNRRFDRGETRGLCVSTQNRRIFISPALTFGIADRTIMDTAQHARGVQRNMPGRHAWRFEGPVNDFRREMSGLSRYHHAFRLDAVLIYEFDTIFSFITTMGQWTARTWPSPWTTAAMDAVARVSEGEIQLIWEDFLQNPMAARETLGHYFFLNHGRFWDYRRAYEWQRISEER